MSKGRFISLLGKQHRIPFDGRLVANTERDPVSANSALDHGCIQSHSKDNCRTCAAHISHSLKASRVNERERQYFFFATLQVVLVTQSVCLIAQMLPEWYGVRIIFCKVPSFPPTPGGCLHLLQHTEAFLHAKAEVCPLPVSPFATQSQEAEADKPNSEGLGGGGDCHQLLLIKQLQPLPQ